MTGPSEAGDPKFAARFALGSPGFCRLYFLGGLVGGLKQTGNLSCVIFGFSHILWGNLEGAAPLAPWVLAG